MRFANISTRLNLDRFFIGEGPEAGPVVLDRRRIYVLPTAHGFRFGVILIIMLLGSMNYSNSLAFVLTFLLGSMAVVSILHCFYNMSQLRFSPGRSENVFAGQRAVFYLRAYNPSERYRLAIGFFTADQAPRVQTLVPGENQVRVEVIAQRRGFLSPGRVKIETRYPLGLFRAWSYVELDQTALVYPAPAASRPFPEQATSGQGDHGDRGVGSDDFRGLRNYQAGDSVSHVHWKRPSPDDSLLTKQFGGESVQEVVLSWDHLAGIESELRLRHLCRWILDAHQGGIFFGLQLPDLDIDVGRGNAHRDRCLEALACFRLTPAT